MLSHSEGLAVQSAVPPKRNHPAKTVKKVGGPKRNLVGLKFGLLTVISYRKSSRGSGKVWFCRCDCGSKFLTQSNKLTSGHTKSCGCLRLKHGHSSHPSPEYRTWTGMITRCLNKNHIAYHYYGGRGIKVCAKWADSFVRFLDDMGPRPRGVTLDRINSNGNYEPSNCRWATKGVQQNNKRDNHIIKFEGRRQTVTAWAREKKVSASLVFSRLNNGWPVDSKLFSQSLRKK